MTEPDRRSRRFLERLAEECDFLVITVPLTPDTRGMVGEEVLAKMKPTAFLVDISRGGVVDHGALVEALNTQSIAGAALDVYPVEPLPVSSPLWEMPHVLITPHTGGETSLYEKRLVDIIVENVRRWERGEPFIHRVV